MKKVQKRGTRITALSLAAVSAFGLLAAPALAGGLQVAIDPATGKIRQPTAEEYRALSVPFAAKSATAAPILTEWADGTLSMVLTAEYLNVWLVGLNANGTASQVCVDGSAAGSAQPAAPALEVK